MKPYANELHPSYHGPKTQRCLGCRVKCARSAWGNWCFACNVARMTRIDRALAPVARALGHEALAREMEE